MKKFKFVMIMSVLLSLFLTGCGGFNYAITTTANRITIELKDAKDGAYADSDAFSVGKDRILRIDPALTDGQLQIEFAEAVVFVNSEGPDDVTKLDVVKTVNVLPGQPLEVELPEGDYVMQLTAAGGTSGKVTINIEKK